MTEYHWIESNGLRGERWLCLVPTDEPNPWSMRRIASIYYDDSNREFVGAYHYPHSTGNKQSGGATCKSRPRAQRYIERQLAAFWEPPAIVGAA